MKKVILIAVLTVTRILSSYGQGGIDIESCIRYHEKTIVDVDKLSEANRKSFYYGEYSCFNNALTMPKYQKDAKIYNAYITACFYTQRWGSAVKAYKKALEMEVNVDREVLGMVLFCWVNAYDAIRQVDTSIIRLANEMVLLDHRWVCLRKNIYEKTANCYDYKRYTPTEYNGDTVLLNDFNNKYLGYSNLALEDAKACDNCCLVETLEQTAGDRGGIIGIKRKPISR